MFSNITHKYGDGEHHISTDSRLSLKARGLWFVLWSINAEEGSDEKFTLHGFVREYSGEGLAATRGAFLELKHYGYIVEECQNYAVRYYTLYERR